MSVYNEDEDDELDEDTQAKLAAIAHPERFTSEPGEMVPEPEDEKRADLGRDWERYWSY